MTGQPKLPKKGQKPKGGGKGFAQSLLGGSRPSKKQNVHVHGVNRNNTRGGNRSAPRR